MLLRDRESNLTGRAANSAAGAMRQLVAVHACEIEDARRICQVALACTRQRHQMTLQHTRLVLGLMSELCWEAEVLFRSLQWRLGNGTGVFLKALLRQPREIQRTRQIRAKIAEFRAWERQCDLPFSSDSRPAVAPTASVTTGEVAELALWTSGEVDRLNDEVQACLKAIPQVTDQLVVLQDLLHRLKSSIRFRAGHLFLIQIAKFVRPRVNTSGFLRRISAIEECFLLWQKIYSDELPFLARSIPTVPQLPSTRWPTHAAESEMGWARLLRAASRRASERQVWKLQTAALCLGQEWDHQRRHLTFLSTLLEHYQKEFDTLLSSTQWRLGNRLITFLKKGLGKSPEIERPRRIQGLFHRFFIWKQGYEQRPHMANLDTITTLFRTVPGGGIRSEVAESIAAKLRCRNVECDQLRQDIAYVSTLFEEIQEQILGLRKNVRFQLGELLLAQIAKVTRLRASSAGFLQRMDILAVCYHAWTKHCRAALPTIPFTFSRQESPGETADLVSNTASRSVEISKRWTPQQLAGCRVIQVTPSRPRNPYYTLLSRNLESRGWNFDYIPDLNDIQRLILQDRSTKNILHFHQLEGLYHDCEKRSQEKTRRNAERLLEILESLKNHGARLVFTQHNPYPHIRDFREVDEFVNEGIADLADRIVVLGEAGVPFMAKYTSSAKIAVVPHPSFRDVYGPVKGRKESRERLGIPEAAFVFGNLGEIRAYKGHDFICQAFQRMCTEAPSPEAMLVFAGKPGPQADIEQLKGLFSERVILHAQEIDDLEVAWWLGAMDAAVFAFSDIWGSSSVVLALSYGIPAIVPDIGFMREYVRDDDTGMLYKHGEVDDLALKLAAMRSTPFREHMRYMCEKFNRDHDVMKTANQMARVYLDVLAGTE